MSKNSDLFPVDIPEVQQSTWEPPEMSDEDRFVVREARFESRPIPSEDEAREAFRGKQLVMSGRDERLSSLYDQYVEQGAAPDYAWRAALGTRNIGIIEHKGREYEARPHWLRRTGLHGVQNLLMGASWTKKSPHFTGQAGDWRLFDVKTGKMQSPTKQEEMGLTARAVREGARNTGMVFLEGGKDPFHTETPGRQGYSLELRSKDEVETPLDLMSRATGLGRAEVGGALDTVLARLRGADAAQRMRAWRLYERAHDSAVKSEGMWVGATMSDEQAVELRTAALVDFRKFAQMRAE